MKWEWTRIVYSAGVPLSFSQAPESCFGDASKKAEYPMAPINSAIAEDLSDMLAGLVATKVSILKETASFVNTFKVSYALARSREIVDTASANHGGSSQPSVFSHLKTGRANPSQIWLGQKPQ